MSVCLKVNHIGNFVMVRYFRARLAGLKLSEILGKYFASMSIGVSTG